MHNWSSHVNIGITLVITCMVIQMSNLFKGLCHLCIGADNQSIETTSHRAVTNPSIGPSIGDASLGMTNSLSASGSHMDRVGMIRDDCDRESASTRALAGSSLNGSLSGSAVAGPSGFQNRYTCENGA